MVNSFFINNAVSLFLLAITSVAYLVLLAGHVPDKYALVINFMLVPLLFGIAGFFLLKGELQLKLVLLAALPLAHVVYFGADSTKPGLENMIAVGEFIFICFGVGLGVLANKYLNVV